MTEGEREAEEAEEREAFFLNWALRPRIKKCSSEKEREEPQPAGKQN